MNRRLPMLTTRPVTSLLATTALLTLGLLVPAAHDPAQAALADLASTPLGVNVSNGKPNVMFILDDSGSMDWVYMPDDLQNPSDLWGLPNNYGSRSSHCNGVGYNPSVTYAVPVNADGSKFSSASYPLARQNGYDSASTLIDLSTDANWRYYYTYTGTQPDLAWRYASDGSRMTTTFSTECLTTVPFGGAGNSVFTRVDTTTLTPAQKTNYANWFSFYSRRYLAMRTAAGNAFAKLDSNYRVGFTRINDTSISGTSFLDTQDFDTTQRNSFFNLLYSTPPNGGTPLRESLSKVGRYYAKTISGQTYDPMANSATDSTLNSCRRNYAILSTDGYWNGATGKQMDGTTDVGNQDSDEVRPMKDSTSTTKVTTTDTTTVTRIERAGSIPEVTTDSRKRYQTISSYFGDGCSFPTSRRKNEYTQIRTTTTTKAYTTRFDRTSISRRDITTVNGVQTADSGDYVVSTSDSGPIAGYPTKGATLSGPTSTAWADSPSSPTGYTCTGDAAGTSYANSATTTVGPTDGAVTAGAESALSTPAPTTSAAPPVVNTSSTAGDGNSLADVAEYYYKNDLRTDIPNNLNVKLGTLDTATHQHMTTFTLGFGLKGVLNYDPNYLTQASGDYVDLKTGAKQWPVPTGTTGGIENATHIDDLWHAAVNGRGRYFSAQDPSEVSTAITSALNTIAKDSGTGSAAATSSLMPTSGGDDLVFLPSFDAARWAGDLKAFHFSYDTNGLITGVDVTDSNKLWSAKAKLDAMTLSARKVYFNKLSGTTPTLTLLSYANLPTGTIKTSFDNRCTVTTPFLQCAGMNTTAKAKVTGTNLVDYLVGDRSLEISATADNSVFRKRDSRLGDFVNASPVYVGGPAFRYADAGYAAFKASKKDRKRVVYAAANDGMLHAFATGTSSTVPNPDATGGTELWAYVPTAALANMAQLGDTAYDTNHQIFVDATPVVGDIHDGSNWRTILVGGLGKGGKSYYALDITDPDAPSLLWEISSTDTGFANLGYTYGNPILTKLKNGTWVVVFSSGVNNVGDGIGRVYVVNATTGALLSSVSTGVGSTTTPSNLVKLNAWLRSDTDNTALRLYGGDMQGNFWRFDHDNNLGAAGSEATLLGVATNAANVRQPITTKPVLVEALIGGVRRPLVSFGTGRYLGETDLADTTQQAIWVLKDNLLATAADTTTTPTSMFGFLRSTSAKLVDQPMTSAHAMGTPQALDWATNNGWFVDLDQLTRERINVDPSYLQGATVAYSSSVPSATSCSGMGSSYVYKLDLSGGTFTLMSTSATKMNVGITTYLDKSSGVNTKSNILATKEDQSVQTIEGAVLPSALGKIPRRSAWREIVD